jgi:Flp pilus assembly protein TadG
MGPARRGALRRREDGAIAVISAVVSVVLLVISAFVVDIGSTWARRGQLQVQADKAALLAASSLPAVDATSERNAAKHVAYYIACHILPGQRQLTPEIPDCPDGTTTDAPAILAYAQQLLDEGSVTFPTSTQVKVVTPPARIDYGFGRVAGAEGSTQSKMAIAKVSSPGDLVPIGLPLPCLLSAVGSLPAAGDTASGLIPLDYVTAGPLAPAGTPDATVWPASYDSSADPGRPALTQLTTVPDPVVSGQAPAAFTLTGPDWGAFLDVQVVFHRGADTGTPVPATSLGTPALLGGSSTVSGVLPDAVMAVPGDWQVKVGIRASLLDAPLWSDPLTLTVARPSGASETVGCARLLDSPRADTTDTFTALERNFQEGIDHRIAGHPSLLSLTTPTLTAEEIVALASDPSLAFTCSATTPHVLDVPNPPGTPNCVRMQGTDAGVGTGFTRGVLAPEAGGVAGRLVCSTIRPCADASTTVTTSQGTVTVNDDDFDQFVVDPNLLRDRLFFGLSTYVTNGIPVVTPDDALRVELYSSHRFMWVPVMSNPLEPAPGADYPVLTFRPVFVTQDAPEGWDTVDLLFDSADALASSLGLGQDDVRHGLLIKDGELAAMRFMTIEPSALPPVPSSYTGPTTEYLGVGPKIVKLVK